MQKHKDDEPHIITQRLKNWPTTFESRSDLTIIGTASDRPTIGGQTVHGFAIAAMHYESTAMPVFTYASDKLGSRQHRGQVGWLVTALELIAIKEVKSWVHIKGPEYVHVTMNRDFKRWKAQSCPWNEKYGSDGRIAEPDLWELVDQRLQAIPDAKITFGPYSLEDERLKKKLLRPAARQAANEMADRLYVVGAA